MRVFIVCPSKGNCEVRLYVCIQLSRYFQIPLRMITFMFKKKKNTVLYKDKAKFSFCCTKSKMPRISNKLMD